MRATGLGISAILITVGAILKWAVTATPDNVNLGTTGLILFIVGLVGVAISLAMFAVKTETAHEQNNGSSPGFQ